MVNDSGAVVVSFLITLENKLLQKKLQRRYNK